MKMLSYRMNTVETLPLPTSRLSAFKVKHLLRIRSAIHDFELYGRPALVVGKVNRTGNFGS